MIVYFNITNQMLTCNKDFSTVEDAVKYVRCKFDFCTSDWDGCEKIAYFVNTKSKASSEQILVNDECYLPVAVISDEGHIEMAVHGIRGDYKVTTNVYEFYNYRTLNNSEITPEPDLTTYEKIMGILADIKNTKLNASGYTPGKIIGVNEHGNLVEMDAPEGSKVLVDETLTFKGQAADAYIVGREVDTLTQEITNVKVEVGNVEVLLKMI